MSKLFPILLLFVVFACDQTIDNPYDQVNTNDSLNVQNEDTLDPSTFAYLHHKVFKPTCANSGCHDGTFEPNFSSVHSSYNTLVYHPIIKNDNQGSYTYRVLPGSSNQSLLMERLNGQMNGNEDQMPIVVEPNSDWPANGATYRQYIANWINAGAKDLFGNSPSLGNKPPQLVGMVAYADGNSTPLQRENGSGTVLVPNATSSLQIFLAFEDDSTSIPNLGLNEVYFSDNINDFSGQPAQSLAVSGNPLQAVGYFGNQVSYFHSISINPSVISPNVNTDIYLRAKVQDSGASPTEIPTDGSFTYFKTYLSFKRLPQ